MNSWFRFLMSCTGYMLSFLSDASIDASDKKRTHASSRLSSVNHFKLCTKLITASFFKKLWQHYSPRWIFCPSPKDEIRIRLQLHCPLSRFCTAIVDVSSFLSPFNGSNRYVLTLSRPILCENNVQGH